MLSILLSLESMIRYKYHVDIVLAVVQEYLAGLILLSDEVSYCYH